MAEQSDDDFGLAVLFNDKSSHKH